MWPGGEGGSGGRPTRGSGRHRTLSAEDVISLLRTPAGGARGSRVGREQAGRRGCIRDHSVLSGRAACAFGGGGDGGGKARKVIPLWEREGDGVRVRRRTRVVGAFLDGRSVRVPACGRWRYGRVAIRGRLGRSLDIGHLNEREGEKEPQCEERA